LSLPRLKLLCCPLHAGDFVFRSLLALRPHDPAVREKLAFDFIAIARLIENPKRSLAGEA
jgi:hypothetical protein